MKQDSEDAPGGRCSVCSGIPDRAYATTKHGWEAYDTYLPDGSEQLRIVRDFRPRSDRKLQLRQCPACGAYFLYTTDYEYLAGGTEDEQTLTRLTNDEAAAYLKEPE